MNKFLPTIMIPTTTNNSPIPKLPLPLLRFGDSGNLLALWMQLYPPIIKMIPKIIYTILLFIG